MLYDFIVINIIAIAILKHSRNELENHVIILSLMEDDRDEVNDTQGNEVGSKDEATY